MFRHEEDGAWYSDLTLWGDYCSLFKDSHILLFDAIKKISYKVGLPIPDGITENVLFLSIYRYGNIIYLCGQGHATGLAYIYTTELDKWFTAGLCSGTWRPILFSDGLVYVVESNTQYSIYTIDEYKTPIATKIKQIGVNGIDIVKSDGSIVTGDDNYNGSHNEIKLAQYTTLDGITAGQSYTNGCIIIDGAKRARIEPGDCKFIRFYRDGNNLAIAIVKQPENKSVFYWLSRSELFTFPDEVLSPEDNTPKEPKMINHEAEVKQLAQQFPIDNRTVSSIFEFTKRVVEKLSKIDNCGFEQKTGENVIIYNNQSVSISRVMYPDGQLFKILSDAGPNGNNGPQWALDDKIDSSRYIPFTNTPNTIPPDNPPTNNGLEERLTDLINKRMADLENKINNLLQTFIRDGDKLALRCNDNIHYLRVHDQGGLTRNQKPTATDSTAVGIDELFQIEKH